MLRDGDRARLEALVESDDPRVSPRDRIEAIKMLQDGGGVSTCPRCRSREQIEKLDEHELAHWLEHFLDPGFLGVETAPKLRRPDAEEAEIERRVEERVRNRLAAMDLRFPPSELTVTAEDLLQPSPADDTEPAGPDPDPTPETPESPPHADPPQLDTDLPPEVFRRQWRQRRPWGDWPTT